MKAGPAHSLRLAFYGDDFTGSTDALESLSLAGARTVLFLHPPSAEALASHGELDAFGVAGCTRALDTVALEKEWRPSLRALLASGAPHVHYKVCSTFDSSPHLGSIGRALEIILEESRQPSVPLLMGTPTLGRYCCFGHLFARYGIGSQGAIHRLDRHPVMSRHPVTPADESDLRLHLARQTALSCGLVDLLALDSSDEATLAAYHREQGHPHRVVLIDGMNLGHLRRAGVLLEQLAATQPLVSVGSSAVGSALGLAYHDRGVWSPRRDWPAPPPRQRLLVLSGSCSPVTAGQIQEAKRQGFFSLAADPSRLAHPSYLQELESPLASALQQGRPTLVYTAEGAQSATLSTDAAAAVGRALGTLAQTLRRQTGVERIVFAGGDTSSYAARALGVDSLSFLCPLTPGAPLCRLHSSDPALDGCEVVFKGGQVGSSNFFVSASTPPR